MNNPFLYGTIQDCLNTANGQDGPSHKRKAYVPSLAQDVYVNEATYYEANASRRCRD